LQYFSDTFPTLKEQLKFEETLFRKTHKANGEGVRKGTLLVVATEEHQILLVCVDNMSDSQLTTL